MAMTTVSTASTLIFLHIPKTAGTTMRSIIRRQYRPDELYAVEDLNWISKNAELPLMREEEGRAIRCLVGHFPYGVHRHLPQPSRYITILRNPVEWTLSTYSVIFNYKYEVKTIPLFWEAAHHGIKLQDFPQFLADNGLANPQTRVVAGFADVAHLEPPFPPLPPRALQVAKDNLDRDILAAGVVERFDESVLLFKLKLGWGNICYRRQNTTQKRIRRNDVPTAVIDRIARCHTLDCELYEEVNRRLDSQIGGLEPQFSRELERFRRVNRRYEMVSRWLGLKGYHVGGRIYASLRSLRPR